MPVFQHDDGDGSGQTFTHEGKDQRPLPPAGVYIGKLVQVDECVRSKKGNGQYHRFRVRFVFGEFRDLNSVIMCDPEGRPSCKGAWGRLRSIAAAVGIERGAKYTLNDLLWMPMRVTVTETGQWRNVDKFEALTEADRKDLADYEAQVALAEGKNEVGM